MKTKFLSTSFKASLVIVSLLLLLGCTQSPGYIQIQGAIFGTTFHISYKDPSTGVDKATVLSDVESRLSELDLIFSTYKANSELSRFNRLDAMPVIGEKKVFSALNSLSVSHEFIDVLNLSRQVYTQSNHSFNPAIGPLVELWGFGPKVSLSNFEATPKQENIDKALAQIDFTAVKNIDQLLYKTSAVRVDFSAIAKGYAVDQIALLLKTLNIEHFMVEIGGELVTFGDNASGETWKIGIEKPDAITGAVSDVLHLHSAALATSGDYRNFFDIDGQRYSHTINPRTGYPVKHKLASVTVITDSSALSDAWATAFMVLGEKESLVLANQYKINSLFIVRQGTTFSVVKTNEFKQYMQ